NGFVESRAPTSQAALLGGEAAGFIGDVVNETHEGVQGNDAVALVPGEQEKCVIEIAVGGTGDAVALVVRRGWIARQWARADRSFPGESMPRFHKRLGGFSRAWIGPEGLTKKDT